MDRLPDTSGLPNEIVVSREQRNDYDHALRATGARVVDRTVAVAQVATPDSAPPVEEIGAVCRRRGLPYASSFGGKRSRRGRRGSKEDRFPFQELALE
jgi:hypothetical protein